MKSFEDDMELRQLLKNIKPDSPGSDFSAEVMNRIFKEQSSLERIKKDPFFGKEFWIIIALFALILVTILSVSSGSAVSGPESSFLPELNFDSVIPSVRSFFARLDTLPAAVAGILLSASMLILIEKITEPRAKAA